MHSIPMNGNQRSMARSPVSRSAMPPRWLRAPGPALLLSLALACGGCAVQDLRALADYADTASHRIADRAIEDRILALDPEHVTDADVRQTLVKGPTPRIMLLHGGIY